MCVSNPHFPGPPVCRHEWLTEAQHGVFVAQCLHIYSMGNLSPFESPGGSYSYNLCCLWILVLWLQFQKFLSFLLWTSVVRTKMTARPQQGTIRKAHGSTTVFQAQIPSLRPTALILEPSALISCAWGTPVTTYWGCVAASLSLLVASVSLPPSQLGWTGLAFSEWFPPWQSYHCSFLDLQFWLEFFAGGPWGRPNNDPQWLPQPLALVNVVLNGKRDFVDIIKFRILRWREYSGLFQRALSMIMCLLIRGGRRRFGYRRMVSGVTKQRLEWCGHRPRNTSSHQKLEEARNGFFPKASRKNHRCLPLDFSSMRCRALGLLKCRAHCPFEPLSCGNFLQWQQETNTVLEMVILVLRMFHSLHHPWNNHFLRLLLWGYPWQALSTLPQSITRYP